jgi:hypothetical protein
MSKTIESRKRHLTFLLDNSDCVPASDFASLSLLTSGKLEQNESFFRIERFGLGVSKRPSSFVITILGNISWEKTRTTSDNHDNHI